MKILKKIGILLLLVFVVMQFFRPEKNESDLKDLEPFLAETNPSESVQNTLKIACYDCHSSNTRYPWYNNIAPVSYWMANHVKHGKEKLNFSTWNEYSLKRKTHKLEEVVEEVKEGHMPIPSYLWTHGDAKLSDAQINELENWVNHTRAILKLGAEKPQ